MADRMTCETVLSYLDAYLDGTTDDTVSRLVAAHIETCPVCHAEYLLRKQLREDVASAAPEVPDDLHDRIMAQIRAEVAIRASVQKTAPRHNPNRVFRIGSIIAAVLLCACLITVPVLTGILGRSGMDKAFSEEEKNENAFGNLVNSAETARLSDNKNDTCTDSHMEQVTVPCTDLYNPTTECMTEQYSESVTEPATEPYVNPVTDPATEPAIEPATELRTEPDPESDSDPLFEYTMVSPVYGDQFLLLYLGADGTALLFAHSESYRGTVEPSDGGYCLVITYRDETVFSNWDAEWHYVSGHLPWEDTP